MAAVTLKILNVSFVVSACLQDKHRRYQSCVPAAPELSLHLRPGWSLSFLLTISMPTDQPKVNMDLSPMPAGVNVTIKSLNIGNPELLQVRKVESDHVYGT